MILLKILIVQEKHWKVIQNIINGTIQDDDPEVYENAFMVVRGWLLKREVKRSIQFDNEFMKKYSLAEFCTFLKNNAYRIDRCKSICGMGLCKSVFFCTTEFHFG